ncbi:2',5'-phosphodiesterase 12 [Dermacentor andersoni]|uniref:2',5'-phosphodiesterase 12 n=1 Tax=Dermacentor andersoni TaxID=34620 RepID=UPI00215557EF|nr:2',5'-phosphodiesterase 12-like [Dermacentor andersoni]
MIFARFVRSKLVQSTLQFRITMSSAVIAAEKLAYVNYDTESTRLRLSFKYASEDLAERQYTLNRKSAEELRVVLSRIALNIANAEEGKKKRKKKKDAYCPEDTSQTDLRSELSISLEHNGLPVSGDVANSDAWKDGSILQIGEQRYVIAVNAPTVRSVRLPKYFMVGFPAYARIELENCSLCDWKLTWYMSVTKGQKLPSHEVRKVNNMLFLKTHHSGPFLTPGASDIGRHVLLTLTPCAGQGMPVEVISSSVVEAGPGICPFEARQSFTPFFTAPGRFRCISYNLLADVYADTKFTRSHLFPYCPSYALDLSYRKQLLIKELLGYKGDLMCLQEVDRRVFQEDLEPILGDHGFNGCYTEKCSPMAEGVACFFRLSKFRALHERSIVLATEMTQEPALSDILASINKNEHLRDRILNLPTALQILLLEPLELPGRLLLVANTHLYYHPDSDHIRLLQAYCCVRLVEWMQGEYTEKYGVVPAVIFAGDFNSCPAFGVYQLMTCGYVSQDSRDWCSNVEEAVVGLEARQKIPLASACGIPLYTNYTRGFQGCLDYIFYDYMQLAREHVVPMPTHQQVTEEEALPSAHFPSDHVAQVATLRWL